MSAVYEVSNAEGESVLIAAPTMTAAAEEFFGTEGLKVWFTGKVDIDGEFAGRVKIIDRSTKSRAVARAKYGTCDYWHALDAMYDTPPDSPLHHDTRCNDCT